MPKRRAQITREAADDMYEDVIDRVTADVDESSIASRPSGCRHLLPIWVYPGTS